MKSLAHNRRASFDYELTEHLLAGIVLAGHEVKSAKASHASIKGAFIAIKNNEAYLMGSHINPYPHAHNVSDIDPTRERKLLLHRRQLNQLVAAKDQGLSIVPTALFLAGRLIKLEIAIGRGKKRYDKRESMKRRDVDREVSRSLAKHR